MAGNTELKFEITTSLQFESWLADAGFAIIVSTYQVGMVLVFGVNTNTGKLRVLNRKLERPMGLAVDSPRLAIAGMNQTSTSTMPAPATNRREHSPNTCHR